MSGYYGVPEYRSNAPLVITNPVTVEWVTTHDRDRGFRRVDLPEPLYLTAGAYTVEVDDDDTVRIERL